MKSEIRLQLRKEAVGGIARFTVGLLALAALAAAADVDAKIASLETAVKSAQSAGDNAWMLVCSALVLMMTGPGLALFYGGLVRRKNVLGTMMQSFIMMAVVTVIWAVAGYSLAFGGSGPFIGNLDFAFLNGVGSAPNPDYAGTIPQQTFMVYQLMFAIITPALISGAFAERMKFSAMLLFTMLWSLFVYFPMAHMVWGKGGFLNAFLGGKMPTFDFAGGTVVHITSGVSALVCALYLGKRVGFPQRIHEAAQPGAELHRRLPAVGRMVRLQRRQRAGRLRPGHQRLRGHSLRRRRGRARLDCRGMDAQRQAQRARRHLRMRRRPGGHHSGVGLRQAVPRAADRPLRRRRLLPDGGQGETEVRL